VLRRSTSSSRISSSRGGLHPQFSASRLRFENRSIFDLGSSRTRASISVTCRHVIQARAARRETVLAELAARAEAGWARLHVIAEDYGMIRFQESAP